MENQQAVIELEQKITSIIAKYGSMVFMNPSKERLTEVLQAAYNLKLFTTAEPHPRIVGGLRIELFSSPKLCKLCIDFGKLK